MACGAGLMGALLESCGSAKTITAVSSGDKLMVKRSDLEGSKSFVVVRGAPANLPADIYLLEEAGKFTALPMLCTHKACDLKPTGKTLTCFCHGSEFSSVGKVLKSPATVDLQPYKVTTDDTSIYIHLK